jgi:putative transposase
MVKELLAARGIAVGHETIRVWAPKFARTFANRIRRRLPRMSDKVSTAVEFRASVAE